MLYVAETASGAAQLARLAAQLQSFCGGPSAPQGAAPFSSSAAVSCGLWMDASQKFDDLCCGYRRLRFCI